LALGWLACAAHAAGGHFDVDDAAVVAPGHCQYETWWTRAPAASTTLFHLGPGCRVGPLELGVNVDRVATAAYDLTHGGRPAQTLYAPLTWAAGDTLAFNLNLGADWDFSGSRTRRIGISAEWAAHDKLSLIGERVKLSGDWSSRLGLRWLLGHATSLDLSAARVGPRATPVYVIGLNHDFAR